MVRVNGLFAIDGIQEVGSGERGFCNKDILLDGFADCAMVDSEEA